MVYDELGKTRVPCPPDTKVFLYYCIPPEKPRIAGELRLRVTSSDDPASFESGSDLLRSNGQPWSRPLHALPKYYNPLYEKLREDQLVPDDLDAALSTLPSPYPKYRRSHHFYSLNDTFILNFCHPMVLLVITEQGTERVPLMKMFSDSHDQRKSPYTGAYTIYNLYIEFSHESLGSVLARFERSTLPEHKGTRTVVLRFLKIITPLSCVIPKYDKYIPCPVEGELYRRGSKFAHQVWNINIDKPHPESVYQPYTTRGLQLLWDA